MQNDTGRYFLEKKTWDPMIDPYISLWRNIWREGTYDCMKDAHDHVHKLFEAKVDPYKDRTEAPIKGSEWFNHLYTSRIEWLKKLFGEEIVVATISAETLALKDDEKLSYWNVDLQLFWDFYRNPVSLAIFTSIIISPILIRTPICVVT